MSAKLAILVLLLVGCAGAFIDLRLHELPAENRCWREVRVTNPNSDRVKVELQCMGNYYYFTMPPNSTMLKIFNACDAYADLSQADYNVCMVRSSYLAP